MKIDELFIIDVAKSHSTDDYDIGNIPFVTNSEINNGIVRYVEPLNNDKVFQKFTICISGLGFATLQINDYLPKGNGGDSATILIPQNYMSIKELLFYTAQFNIYHKWRFSFGRKCSKRRVAKLLFSRVYHENDKYDLILDQVKNKLLKKIELTRF
jgi:hypothetical protein